MMLQNCKLTYFGIPGRGEATRLALVIGGILFTDDRIPFTQWAELKPTTPWGSLPVLTLASGQKIAQQRAVLRFVGQQVGLYRPSDDPVKAAWIDGLMDATEDIGTTTNDAGRGLTQELKQAARAAVVAPGGATYSMLQKVESFIAEHGDKGFAVGDSLTIADLYVFSACGSLVSGLYDGVPLQALDGGAFPHIQAVRKTVRSHPAVQKWYDELNASTHMPASYGPFK